MTRSEFTFFYEFRVRYAEVDSQGIVFNAHYLTYFDTAITEYMRKARHDYLAMVSKENLDFHLIKSTVEYLRPIGFDEIIQVGVSVARIGNSSLTWRLGIFQKENDKCMTKGEIIWVCSKVGEHKSHPLPVKLINAIKSFEGQDRSE